MIAKKAEAVEDINICLRPNLSIIKQPRSVSKMLVALKTTKNDMN
jgi:hypothetical protein